MLYLLGLACIAWTAIELFRMSRATPEPVRPQSAAPPQGPARPRRLPLAAWDDEGRPIFVEDVSHRGPR